MELEPHRIVIAGGSGLIGNACQTLFRNAGIDVCILTRQPSSQKGAVQWDPERRWIDRNVVDGAAAVMNLCGIPLPEHRWTAGFKHELVRSRVIPATYLGELISASSVPPGCYIGISGTGVYGDRGTQPIHEEDGVEGQGFIPDLVRAWEAAHRAVNARRMVILRTAPVLSAKAGFLARMIPPSRFGLYPCFGTGRQIISWIHLDDLAHFMLFTLQTPSISGMYHLVAPGSVSQRQFMRTLRQVSRRPGIVFPVPEFMLRLMFGEMASILFESIDVRPDKILATGFAYQYPELGQALEKETRKSAT